MVLKLYLDSIKVSLVSYPDSLRDIRRVLVSNALRGRDGPVLQWANPNHI